MRILFWNIHGFGCKGRRTQLRELLLRHRIDVICLQETIKHDFSDLDLQGIEIGDKFYW